MVGAITRAAGGKARGLPNPSHAVLGGFQAYGGVQTPHYYAIQTEAERVHAGHDGLRKNVGEQGIRRAARTRSRLRGVAMN